MKGSRGPSGPKLSQGGKSKWCYQRSEGQRYPAVPAGPRLSRASVFKNTGIERKDYRKKNQEVVVGSQNHQITLRPTRRILAQDSRPKTERLLLRPGLSPSRFHRHHLILTSGGSSCLLPQALEMGLLWDFPNPSCSEGNARVSP